MQVPKATRRNQAGNRSGSRNEPRFDEGADKRFLREVLRLSPIASSEYARP